MLAWMSDFCSEPTISYVVNASSDGCGKTVCL